MLSQDTDHQIEFLKNIEASLELYCKTRCKWKVCLEQGFSACPIGKSRKKIFDEKVELQKERFANDSSREDYE